MDTLTRAVRAQALIDTAYLVGHAITALEGAMLLRVRQTCHADVALAQHDQTRRRLMFIRYLYRVGRLRD